MRQTSDEPTRCPYCASEEGVFLAGEDLRHSITYGGQEFVADEWQCRDEDCGRSFWAPQ